MAATKIEISIKTIFTILIVGIVLYVLSCTTDILTQVFIAFIIMIALTPVVKGLQKLRFPRTVAIIVTYVLFILTLIVVLAAMVPAFIDQTARLLVQLNLPSQPILDKISHFQFSVTTVTALVSTYSGSLGKALEIISSTFSGLFTFFTVLVMAVYMMLGREQIYTYFTIFFRTSDKRERSKHMVDAIEAALGSWIRAQFV
jgi:predicted PurR-regulated permease PerM